MLHHERIIPPPHIYIADAWNMIEKKFNPEFLDQTETIYSVGNGYLGMRGCPEEGGPNFENATFVNGFYESWPIVYGEKAFGFAKTGQTIVNVTDSKIIKLYVDDEPFWLPKATMLQFDRRLNMKSGTLDREVLWETPSGKHVLIKSRRLVSFQHRHLAAISYQVTVLNSEAPIVISSEMAANQVNNQKIHDDPRHAKAFTDRVLHPTMNYGKDRRIVLCHWTQNSQLGLACTIDHTIETECLHSYKSHCTEDSGQVVFSVEAKPGHSINLTKYISYHTSQTASADELCGRAERTVDRAVAQGFSAVLARARKVYG